MFITVLIYLLLFFAAVSVIRSVYKVIWYTVKMLGLKSEIKKLQKKDVKVTCKAGLLKTVFGKCAIPCYVLEKDGKKYEVGVISFISVHSRYNIEKTPTRYLFEVRKHRKLIYNVYNNSGTEPDLSKDYRREISLCRKEIFVSEITPEFDKQIWLVYPKPYLLTYAENKWEYLNENSIVAGHEIMFGDSFFEIFK